ncbi:nicotinatenucleotide pyrophosphorylase putative [Ochromonadaceae sp. CCMP2298]|nr:nicotinatenucleotide pyrophosphorylase putative [Ochromonadaceae sp. CCMP2298]
MSSPVFAHLLPATFKEEVIQWAREDCPATDIGGFVVGEKIETATLYCKSTTVLAGVPFACALLDFYGLTYTWTTEEGQLIDVEAAGGKVVVAKVEGKCRDILLVERTCLNILSRASGVAAAARKAVQIKEKHNWHGYVAGTRKTTPGFKSVEKYALVVGGAATHRLDLSQMVMLKDNHIWSAGSITNAVKKARSAAGFSMKIEVECQSVAEALEAAAAGADIVMLDNFTSDSIEAAAGQIKAQFPHILVEASGGITEATMGEFMSPSVDVISRGSLTQGYACADFSLKIDRK